VSETYPGEARARDRWVRDRRDPASHAARDSLDPKKPYAQWVEDERADDGRSVRVATIFLTNRECPWRCLMCDLWKNTLSKRVPLGAIPEQIRHALEQLPPAEQIKLYNAGSFFDRQAIPPQDFSAIAGQLAGFRRVIVESHPSLVGDACVHLRDLLADQGVADLEVAMGLETANPEVLEKLNKRMTLEQFARAAEFLQRQRISLRVFILIQPPFMAAQLALHWAKRSLDFAFDCGASVAVLIPTRPGNGATEALAASGDFAPPRLALLEDAADYGVALNRGRVLVDLWDIERLAECTVCHEKRTARLEMMNREQIVSPRVYCDRCGEGA
jgi:archaeosine synthase beta-subunit